MQEAWLALYFTYRIMKKSRGVRYGERVGQNIGPFFGSMNLLTSHPITVTKLFCSSVGLRPAEHIFCGGVLGSVGKNDLFKQLRKLWPFPIGGFKLARTYDLIDRHCARCGHYFCFSGFFPPLMTIFRSPTSHVMLIDFSVHMKDTLIRKKYVT